MSKKQKIYWLCQIIGWMFYVIVNLLFFGLSYSASFKQVLYYLLLLPTGIILTHTLRSAIIKLRVLNAKVYYQLFFIIASSLALSVIFSLVNFSLGALLDVMSSKIDIIFSLELIINSTVPFTFWSLVYFGFHYLENYKKEELQNLRWEAASKEIELNKLKSQLNPHFMFNSMNSIRALIDEDPVKAKEAVTQLSNILRNTLLMNKNKVITLEEELNIVKDYLELEKIRYEDRLQYEVKIEPGALKKNVPPLIVQGQVENAIKHGISKLPSGGRIEVHAVIMNDNLKIEVMNTGKLSNSASETGFGLSNSRQRLELLYGNRAMVEIKDISNNEVCVNIQIPL